MDKLEVLSTSQLFHGLSKGEVQAVARYFRERRYLPGQTVFLQGRRADLACIVGSGSVKLTQHTPEGHEVILRMVNPGEAFGVIAALIDDLYPLTAIAREDSTVLCCPASRFRQLVEEFPTINQRALRMISARLRDAFTRIRELSLERVDTRIARALLRAADGVTQRSGRPVIRLTRQELAELTGTTLTTASRTVARFHRLGLVKAGREKISIVALEKLQALAEETAPKESFVPLGDLVD